MSEEIEKLSSISASMAEIAAANASIEAMKVENDDRRSRGEADAYSSDDFWKVSESLKEHAQDIRDAKS